MDCVRRINCLGFNYDLYEKECFLFEQCQRLENDEKFETTFIGEVAELCLKWLPMGSDVVSLEMVSMYRCHHNPDYAACHVARLQDVAQTLPGKFDGRHIYTVLNGVKHTSGTQEVLYVLPGCQVEWVAYNAGSTIPHQAVVGGYLANGPGVDLYVIRGILEGYTIPGYYDPTTEEGYVDYDGPRRVNTMEMLIVK